jgi:hypothetical protein
MLLHTNTDPGVYAGERVCGFTIVIVIDHIHDFLVVLITPYYYYYYYYYLI